MHAEMRGEELKLGALRRGLLLVTQVGQRLGPHPFASGLELKILLI